MDSTPRKAAFPVVLDRKPAVSKIRGRVKTKCARVGCKNVFTHDSSTSQDYCSRLCRLFASGSKKGRKKINIQLKKLGIKQKIQVYRHQMAKAV